MGMDEYIDSLLEKNNSTRGPFEKSAGTEGPHDLGDKDPRPFKEIIKQENPYDGESIIELPYDDFFYDK